MSAREPFERVVDTYGRTVWRVCRGLLPEHDAEDAWAETMLAALRAYDRLAPDSDLRAWLVTIAHRKAVDVLRAGNRAALPVEELPEAPSRHGIPGRRDLDLWAALALLPDGQRFAVVQHHLGGLPFAQVAALTGGSADAARKAASDGVRRLRSILTVAEEEAS